MTATIHRETANIPLRGRRMLGALAFALGASYASACQTVGKMPLDTGPRTATISVENHEFNDRVIYVVVSGTRQRLGIARGEATTKLTIPATALIGSTPVRFIADPIGGNGAERSEQIVVYPGDEVDMMIEGP